MWIQAVGVECSSQLSAVYTLANSCPLCACKGRLSTSQSVRMTQWRSLLKCLGWGLAHSECLMSIKVIFLILLWKHNNAHKGLVLSAQKKYCSNDLASFN